MRRDFSNFSSRRTSGRKTLVWVTCVLVLLIGIDVLTGGAVRGGFQGVSASVWKAGAGAYTVVFDSGYFLSHRTLARENAALREQLARNKESVATITALTEENEALRVLVQLAASEKGITAPIVSSVHASPYGTFLIGAGEKDAITEGSLVLSQGGFVVGTVERIGEKESMVKEVLAAGESFQVLIRGSATALEGRGGGNGRGTLPRDTAVSEGDVVTAPSFGGRPVGVVGSVESSAAQAEAIVYVALPVNLSSLRYVYVLP